MSLDLSTFRVRGDTLAADLTAAMTTLSFDGGAGAVAQLTANVLDADGVFLRSALATPGSDVTWRDDAWQVGAVTTEWTDDNRILHQLTCRSALARGLRRKRQASVETRVSPSEWVARRIAQRGGIAICQPSSRQSTIAQASGNERPSDLDMIANLGSDLGWTWVEWGNRFWFGSRHWAWTGGATGQRTWSITRNVSDRSDAVAARLGIDDDDTENTGTGTVTVPYALGVRIRPWDLLNITQRGPRSGTWLVDKISFPADAHTPIQLEVSQPRRPAAKAGSST